jgi:hypothetical protein
MDKTEKLLQVPLGIRTLSSQPTRLSDPNGVYQKVYVRYYPGNGFGLFWTKVGKIQDVDNFSERIAKSCVQRTMFVIVHHRYFNLFVISHPGSAGA